MKIRKAVAGADSYGHFWENDNDVLEIDAEEAAHLLVIPDGGFSIVEDHEEFHDDAGLGLPDDPDTAGGRRQAVRVARDTAYGRVVRDADIAENTRPGGEGRDQGVGPHAANQATVGRGSQDGTPGVTRTPEPDAPLDPAQNSASTGAVRSKAEPAKAEPAKAEPAKGRGKPADSKK